MQAVDLRPLGIGEILDVGIKIVWRHAWTFVRTVLVVVAPVQLFGVLVQFSALPDDVFETRSAFDPVDESEIWVYLAAALLAGLLGLLATTLAAGACFKAVADAYLGEQPSWRTSVGFALRRLHSLLWIALVYWVAVGIGIVLCILPGIWIGVAWALAVPVLLAEGRKGFGAVGRSYGLVRGRWWPSFALVLVAVLMAGFLSLVAQYLAAAPAFTDAGDNVLLVIAVDAIGQTLGALLWTPLIAAFVTVLYFDLRVRKEGFDLALLAERIGVAEDPDRVPLAPRAESWGSEQPPEQPPEPPRGWDPGGRDG